MVALKQSRRIRTVALIGVLVVTAGALVAPAGAQVPPGSETVTLEATDTKLSYGGMTTLKGYVSSGEANETVEIIDELGKVVAETITIDTGEYFVDFKPKRGMTLVAQWGAATSENLRLRVKAITHVNLSNVRLFEKATIKGGAIPGGSDKALVTLVRAGKVVAKKRVATSGGDFTTGFLIKKPGKYAAKVRHRPQGLQGSHSSSRGINTPLPKLHEGSRGSHVGALEKRLHQLNYYLTGFKDNYYDARTADAVRAFNKVNGRERVETVDAGTWKALASPKKPRAKTKKGSWIEVDQTKQIFYQVEAGKIKNILHISTGVNGATRDGRFKIYKKGGQGAEFYPSYFDGARAFHVWADVPTWQASAGCIRLPYWTRNWYWKKTPIGRKVFVYHS